MYAETYTCPLRLKIRPFPLRVSLTTSTFKTNLQEPIFIFTPLPHLLKDLILILSRYYSQQLSLTLLNHSSFIEYGLHHRHNNEKEGYKHFCELKEIRG